LVTVDSNVWISALVFRKGKAHELLQQALEGRIRVAITDAILSETLESCGTSFTFALRT
jgi:predicted nucleic acid-binding protein